VPEAGSRAGAGGARLVLLRVVPPPMDMAAAASFGGFGPPAMPLPETSWEQEEAAARGYLQALAGRLGAPERVRLEVRRGDAAGGILQAAAEARAEVILMATHGRSGVARLVLGSVAEAVVHRAPVPVLLVRPGMAAGSP